MSSRRRHGERVFGVVAHSYYSLLSLIFRGGVFQQSLNIIETINITETGDLGDPQLFTSNSTPNNVQNWPKRGRKGNPQIRG